MMTAATSFGFESIDTWLVSSSVVVAFMRFAKERSKSGAIAASCFDTMYHDGSVFHATLVDAVHDERRVEFSQLRLCS
jgi:hypothetical protein